MKGIPKYFALGERAMKQITLPLFRNLKHNYDGVANADYPISNGKYTRHVSIWFMIGY